MAHHRCGMVWGLWQGCLSYLSSLAGYVFELNVVLLAAGSPLAACIPPKLLHIPPQYEQICQRDRVPKSNLKEL